MACQLRVQRVMVSCWSARGEPGELTRYMLNAPLNLRDDMSQCEVIPNLAQ